MQVGKAGFFPCSEFLVKPKNKKNPLDLQHQYVSKCLISTSPPPPKVSLLAREMPKKLPSSPIPPPTPHP